MVGWFDDWLVGYVGFGVFNEILVSLRCLCDNVMLFVCFCYIDGECFFDFFYYDVIFGLYGVG